MDCDRRRRRLWYIALVTVFVGCLHVAVATSDSTELTGSNVCAVLKTNPESKAITTEVPISISPIKSSIFCLLNWGFRCNTDGDFKETVSINVEEASRQVYIVNDCCSGYERTPNGTHCIPKCNVPCFLGECVAPDVCKCHENFEGPYCTRRKACPPGKYGFDCLKTCQCPSNATCDSVGNCYCPPGYKGDNCDTVCPKGFYGLQCQNECHCQNNATCDPINGNCQCSPGYIGKYCESVCPDGLFGLRCQNKCKCQNGAKHCEPINGTCLCPPGYSGENCENVCSEEFYGHQCHYECKCQNGATCDSVTGNCTCKPGYTGLHCESLCLPGYCGRNCRRRCKCQNDSVCNPTNGSCTCGPGYMGKYCSVICSNNNYGYGCKNKCTCKNGAKCNPVNGSCKCPKGYMGQNCEMEVFKTKTYGRTRSLDCNCNWFKTDSCDPLTGKCICKYSLNGVCQCAPGWTGYDCGTVCPHGTFGIDCSSVCNCKNGASCRPTDGNCMCKPGFYGPTCSEDYKNFIAHQLNQSKTGPSWIYLDISVILSYSIISVLFAAIMICYFCYRCPKNQHTETNYNAGAVNRSGSCDGRCSKNLIWSMGRPFTFANQTFIQDENYRNLAIGENGKTRTPGDGSDTGTSVDPSEHVYLEIAERKEDLYDHLDFLRPTGSWKPHYQRAFANQEQSSSHNSKTSSEIKT